MGQPGKNPDQRFTYADYCTWPEDERWELIDGVAYAMSPAPARVHADLTKVLFLLLEAFFEHSGCHVYFAPFDVRLPKPNEGDEETDTVVQPDILVVCDEKKLDVKGCRGAPDLVIEILSPSTASKDCIQKRALYEAHGIKEYWIVDPINRLLTVYVREDDALFGKARIFSDHDKVKGSEFPGLEIDLAEVFPFQPKVVKESPKEYRL